MYIYFDKVNIMVKLLNYMIRKLYQCEIKYKIVYNVNINVKISIKY